MSSKFIPPKVGSKAWVTLMISSDVLAFISISNASTLANFLNKTALPSPTGLKASGPILPNPRTAVPLDKTATKFALFVY